MDLFWVVCGWGAGTGLPLAGGMLLAGLLGGAGHCSLMCGAFALSQVAERFADGAGGRLWTAVLLPYQLGRGSRPRAWCNLLNAAAAVVIAGSR
jgi:hypothetical protein